MDTRVTRRDLLRGLVAVATTPRLIKATGGFKPPIGKMPTWGKTSNQSIHMETDHLVYEIGADGMNRVFQDRQTGKNYLGKPSNFMSIERGGRHLGSTAIELENGDLRVRFDDSGLELKVRIRAYPHYLTLELISVNDRSVAIVKLVNLPLTLTKYISSPLASCRDDEYAAALIPLNIETHTYHGTGPVLLAEADSRVRLVGAKIALLGCPTKELLKRIEQVELDYGLPHPTLGGIWARTSIEEMKSYLFVDLSEDTADAMIDYAKAGGFGTIVVYDGVWDSSHGTYPVNLKNFPHGDAGLRSVSGKIHRAGLKFGMHNLDMVIDKSDAMVHPVPSSGFMMYPDRRRLLAAAVDARDTFLPTTTSPAGLLTKADKSRFDGRDLRIGDEIVIYDDLQTKPPYGFTGCRRGAHGTVAAPHSAGAVINNFAEFIGFYLPDVKSDLYDRVARNEAAALDRYAFDFIYPDGTGENLSKCPERPFWYIYNLLISKLYGYTKREVLFAHDPPNDYSWHIFTRGNTTDYVDIGMIEHFDRVSLAGVKRCVADLLPFEFGWFGFLVHTPASEATRPREMEYAWSKALAYGAAMSLETEKKKLDANGRTREIFAIIQHWEELKLKNYFPEHIREQLKTPGQEFTLERASTGQRQVLPVTYSPAKYVTGKDFWTVDNQHDAQPLRVTIEAKPALAKYGDLANIILLDPARPLHLNTSGSGPLGVPARQTKGLTFELKGNSNGFEVTAQNPTSAASKMGWGCAEVILDSAKDLRQHRALGTFVEGDGSGTYLHFVLEDASRWSVRDYYVRLDFKGRKYVQIPEAAKGEVYTFDFPYSNYWAIRGINFQTISRVYIFLTNLPPGSAARARFGRLEALQEISLTLQNPGVSVNGESLRFPTQLETEWYLEYSGTGKARVFDPNGFTKAEVAPSAKVPSLRHGRNKITFLGEPAPPAKVTFLTRGEPLR